MNISKLWNKPQSTFELVTRLILVASIVAAGAGMAWIFVSLRLDKVIAANTVFAQTTKRPSAVALDGNGHVWVAESDCDSLPLCASSIGRGAIAEYDAVGGGLSKIAEFIPNPSNIYNPTFLVFDKQGNVWFTDPTHGAIGRLVPATNKWTEYSVSNRFHNAVPYDLVFDKNGTLWFTDYINGAIGRFDTERNAVVSETHTPSQGAALYSITQAPDGMLWYTINNEKALGSFKPPLKGAPVLEEHAVPTDQLHTNIADDAGDIWFSGGFHGQVGEYVPTSGQTKMYCVSGASNSSHIAGITVDDNSGDVWFIDSTNARIGVLDPTQYQNDCATGGTSGIAYSQLAANSHPLDGITVDGAGDVFFTDLAGKDLGEISIAPAKPKPTSPYPPGPVAKTWYFPDGHIGDGYRESITLNNPDPTNQCTLTLQYIRGTGQTMSRQIKLNPASRVTESVNDDFHLTEKVHGDTISAIVSNNVDSDCLGIVAERSLYFTIGDNSGTDIVGATDMVKSFYFADVTSGLGARSSFSILNPPGGRTADVHIDYYASGTHVGMQSIQVAGSSDKEISPTQQMRLPLHSAAVVTSSEPVVVEQSTFFHRYVGSSFGALDGATALIGAPAVQHQWFFTAGAINEPDVSGRSQSDLMISNLDLATNIPAQVTITLTSSNKSLQTFHLTVQPRTQITWNIEQHVKGKTFIGVAATVTSAGAGIIVQRQTFFQYAHTIDARTVNAEGVTDVLGQKANSASYSFAEGNSNDGYQEWLHLYNPTNRTAIIYVTMISALGDVYSRSFGVEAYGQMTLDISTYAQQQLGIPGNIHSYEVFLTVQTLNNQRFVAERVQYFNTLGSDFVVQGGTDVFGYAGP